LGAAVATTAVLATAGPAAAAFPDFSDCPRTAPGVTACVNIQSRTGSMTIKGFTVPLGDSLLIRGALEPTEDGDARFYAPRGTNGFFAKPVQVPGGILGIDLPLSINEVTATATLAGPASSIRIDANTANVSLPLKLKLSNPLIGPFCQIGTDSNPAHINLITGTTNPPPPNRPISGQIGTLGVGTTFPGLLVTGNHNVDNSFAVPSSSGCGLGLGLLNAVINAKLKLPSAAGNNELLVTNDVALLPIA
jgi:hypothetical protein